MLATVIKYMTEKKGMEEMERVIRAVDSGCDKHLQVQSARDDCAGKQVKGNTCLLLKSVNNVPPGCLKQMGFIKFKGSVLRMFIIHLINIKKLSDDLSEEVSCPRKCKIIFSLTQM